MKNTLRILFSFLLTLASVGYSAVADTAKYNQFNLVTSLTPGMYFVGYQPPVGAGMEIRASMATLQAYFATSFQPINANLTGWAAVVPSSKADAGDISNSSLTTTSGYLLGRSTNGVGVIEKIQVGANLTLSGGVLSATGGGGSGGSVAFSAITGAPSENTALNSALNGKASVGTVTTSGLTMSTARLLGRFTSSTGALEEVALGTGLSVTGGVLNVSGGGGGSVAFSAITGAPTDNTALAAALTAKASTGAVGSSGLTMATSRFLGRTTASTGAVEELTATQFKTGLALENVSNLAPSALPISTATQTALDLKATLATQVIRPDTAQALSASAQAQAQANAGIVGTGTRTVAAIADQTASLARSQASYADNAAFVEPWANLSGWGAGATLQVSGGKLYSTASPATGTAGANRSYVLSGGETMRYVTTVFVPAAAAAGSVLIGVSSSTAGSTPSGSPTATRGLFFDLLNNLVKPWDGSGGTTLTGTLVTGTYVVTTQIDATWISISAQLVGSNLQYFTRFARSGYTTNNLFVFITDARALSGAYVGPVGARKGMASVAPRTGIEDLAQTVQWTGDGVNNYRIARPANFDSRIPGPVAICTHGTGRSESMYFDEEPTLSIANYLLAAGYTVVTCNYIANNTTWGQQNGLNAIVSAYNLVKATQPVGSVVIVGHSMGGIEGLSAIQQGKIPGIVAFVGNNPTVSLRANYDFSTTFAGQIRTAYGMAGDGSDYSSKATGFDPALYTGNWFGSIPFFIFQSTDDTVVEPATNSSVLQANATPFSRNFTVVTRTGGHGAAILSGQLTQMITWLDGYAKH